MPNGRTAEIGATDRSRSQTMSMTKNRPTSCFIAVLFLLFATTANAALYLIVNIGDGEDREAGAAADNLKDARNGAKPSVIDSGAKQYYVHLPGATMDTLSGSALRVGEPAPAQSATAMTATMGMTAGGAISDAGAGTANDDSGDTDWVEYRASAASLMLFSPDGADEESDIRFEPARVFLRRFDDGSVYVMITAGNGDPPPPDTSD